MLSPEIFTLCGFHCPKVIKVTFTLSLLGDGWKLNLEKKETSFVVARSQKVTKNPLIGVCVNLCVPLCVQQW